MEGDYNMIREAKPNDYIEICKICVSDLGYDCKPELVKARIENLDKNREKVFVADVDGKAVGFVHAEKFNTLYYKDMMNVQGMAVAKKYRRNGYGKMLMHAAENWAADNHVDVIRLNSGIDRKTAHDFYRKLGYVNEKEQIRFIYYL
jgi:hypothetical protein